MNTRHNQLLEIEKLLNIMDDLREKCPWDRKQNFETLRNLTIEETYELSEAIIENNYEKIKDELGDLLLHIVFYSKLGSEIDKFDIGDIAKSISKKLVSRHPHVYDELKVNNQSDVKKNWEKIKLKEGRLSVLSNIPTALPALIKALRIQEKASNVGFDWKNTDDVWLKVKEEEKELIEAINKKELTSIEEEYGDLMFSLINFARFINIDPEKAIEKTNKKFISRFKLIEKTAKKNKKSIDSLGMEYLDKIWRESKNKSV
ncbi:MAG: nucleoside triphosphate pyrophosphohydrolase [Flavobacteriaceae bacterium]|nr:nucleoside triphosphate pyrophosphohydrolase [Flavobacteriaceae bacterium]